MLFIRSDDILQACRARNSRLHRAFLTSSWGSYQIRKIAGCACARNAGNVFPAPRVSDPDMHHGTCVTHVPWRMPGLLTSGFIWSRLRGKRSRHFQRMRNPQFCISGKRPITRHNREKKQTKISFRVILSAYLHEDIFIEACFLSACDSLTNEAHVHTHSQIYLYVNCIYNAYNFHTSHPMTRTGLLDGSRHV